MGDAPLVGKRLVLTRTPEQGGALKQALEELGAAIVTLPAIAIAPPASYDPLDAALLHSERYQWLVVTSSNGVRALRERLHALGLPLSTLAHLQFAAVGPSTAAAVRVLGYTVAITPERYVAEELAAALGPHTRGQRVLLVRAHVARDVIPAALAAAGAMVEIADAYQTVVPAGAAEQMRELFSGQTTPAAVLFASSSAARNFIALLAEARLDRPRDLRAVSIGSVTSATLRELGWPPAIEAAEATSAGLVDACVRLFSR